MLELRLPVQLAQALAGVEAVRFLRLGEAADVLETTPEKLRELVDRGVVRGDPIGNTLVFDAKELARAVLGTQLTDTASVPEMLC